MNIHRCRFVPYPPSTINALAFSHPSTNSRKGGPPSTLRLAVGRANGDIDIWNPLKGAWFHETTLKGGKDRSIEGLAWTQEPDEEDENGAILDGKLRLFSIGYSAAVTEWDLSLGKPIRHTSGNYGEIWCLAAQPKWQAMTKEPNKLPAAEGEFRGQNIVVGCADGAVVLLSTADGDLKFHRSLSRASAKKARILSITFQNRFIVIAGCADSTIRVFDTRSGQILRSMSLGSGPTGGPKEILVWSVKCLSNGSIVSGDSTGEVRFWDGKNYTLSQRLKSHRADVLDLETSMDGNTVISGGMDRRSIVYKRVGTGKGQDRRRWAKVLHRRFHSHDVKTMATFEAKNFSVIASGGIDTTPVIIPLREFGLEYHQTLPGLPQYPAVQSAPEKRLLMSWWEREVWIWRISRPNRNSSSDDEADTSSSPSGRKLVAKITLSSEESITSASLSANGGILAVSTVADVKIFRLRERRSVSEDILRVNKLESDLFPLNAGGKLVQFSPDARWLFVIDNSSRVCVIRITHHAERQDGDDPTNNVGIYPRGIRLERLNRHRGGSKSNSIGALGNYDRVISRLAFSLDSRIVVVGDLSGYLDSWVLEGHDDTQPIEEDTEGDDSSSEHSFSEGNDYSRATTKARPILGQQWIRNPSASLLPKLPSAPIILSFRPPPSTNPHQHTHDLPVGENRLLVLTSEHQMYEFEVLEGRLSAWSRRNPSQNLPDAFRGTRARAMGCIWDTNAGTQRLWLYGSSWIWMLNLSKDFRVFAGDSLTNKKGIRKKRKHNEIEERKCTSGAGSRIHDSELETGIGRKILKTTGLDKEPEWVSLETPHRSDIEVDEGGQEASALVTLRREIGQGGDDNDMQGAGAAKDLVVKGRQLGRSAWWSTYKYRPIMGMVPIGLPHDDGKELAGGRRAHASQDPEVVLVERPLWDVDLPPRYHGDQEWVK
ncbi:MAG: U3 small nucleolar RNA-associated protein [Geoglossum umbratile]|nr:MAG: U3 small nucleolar RNA-associated protein [Geoglossum umbratile]